mmetsp:Transcript_98870/g.279786  ORF Transcript_98870/g.279786 Transcript_98870/m.279786 type:complete len:383 (-) Transcript_98870:860-2008(-)
MSACQHTHGLWPQSFAPVADHLRPRLLVPELGADAVGDDHEFCQQPWTHGVPSGQAVLVCNLLRWGPIGSISLCLEARHWWNFYSVVRRIVPDMCRYVFIRRSLRCWYRVHVLLLPEVWRRRPWRPRKVRRRCPWWRLGRRPGAAPARPLGHGAVPLLLKGRCDAVLYLVLLHYLLHAFSRHPWHLVCHFRVRLVVRAHLPQLAQLLGQEVYACWRLCKLLIQNAPELGLSREHHRAAFGGEPLVGSGSVLRGVLVLRLRLRRGRRGRGRGCRGLVASLLRPAVVVLCLVELVVGFPRRAGVDLRRRWLLGARALVPGRVRRLARLAAGGATSLLLLRDPKRLPQDWLPHQQRTLGVHVVHGRLLIDSHLRNWGGLLLGVST